MNIEESQYGRDLNAQNEIKALALKYGLASKYTSFIGVDQNTVVSRIEPPMKYYQVSHEHSYIGNRKMAVPTLHLVLRLRAGGGCNCLSEDCKSCSRNLANEENGKTAKIQDPLIELIELQNANGSFKFGTALKCSEAKLKSTCPKNKSLTSWITAYAIALFQKKFENQEDLWNLVVEKAETFVKNNAKGNIKALIETASKMIDK